MATSRIILSEQKAVDAVESGGVGIAQLFKHFRRPGGLKHNGGHKTMENGLLKGNTGEIYGNWLNLSWNFIEVLDAIVGLNLFLLICLGHFEMLQVM